MIPHLPLRPVLLSARLCWIFPSISPHTKGILSLHLPVSFLSVVLQTQETTSSVYMVLESESGLHACPVNISPTVISWRSFHRARPRREGVQVFLSHTKKTYCRERKESMSGLWGTPPPPTWLPLPPESPAVPSDRDKT